MTQQVLEGKVTEVLPLVNNKWVILRLAGREKPLGIAQEGFTGSLPQVGDRISVEVNPGRTWDFAQHRTLVIKKGPEAYPRFEEYFKNKQVHAEAVQAELASILIDYLRDHPQISSDDVHDTIMLKLNNLGLGNVSPKIVGMVFGKLARARVIHKVGRKKTERRAAHAREIAVWEATRK